MAAAGGAVTDRDLKRPRALGGADLARADEAPRLGKRAGAGLRRGHLRRERRLAGRRDGGPREAGRLDTSTTAARSLEEDAP